MKRVRILVVKYNNEIKLSEIKLFRGAVIDSMGADSDMLFHNHSGDALLYRYPKVQYKRIKGKAAIVCVDEGADIIGEFFNTNKTELQIGQREDKFTLSSINADEFVVNVWDSMFTYRLSKWLPFNQNNHTLFQTIEGIIEKTAFLEKILTANILAFAKGVGIFFDGNVKVRILDIEKDALYKYKGVLMNGLDIEFKTNVSLPPYIGIGKGVSLGFGMVSYVKQ